MITAQPLKPIGFAFPRGMTPTSRHQLMAATPFRPAFAPPAQFAMVPKQLSYWGNSQYGDCVTAEEAFAKACCNPEIFITEQEVIHWAGQHGVLNGADLPQVMDMMKSDGFHQDSNVYGDGGKLAVDYSNEAVLQAAISTGNQGGGAPVKLGMDANALPSGAGNQQGWYKFGGRPGQFNNEDHSTGLCGYGTAAFCFGALGVPVPAGVDPNKPNCYLHFTWSTIGVVDHDWIMSTVGEAWIRNPSSTINGQPVSPVTPPTPPTPPVPTPFGPLWEFFLKVVAWIKSLFGGKAAIQADYSAFPWSILIVVVKQLLTTFGPTIIPLIEAEIAKLPLPPLVIAEIDAILESFLLPKA